MKSHHPLRHYRYKRWCYRFRLMGSPRSAGLVGNGLALFSLGSMFCGMFFLTAWVAWPWWHEIDLARLKLLLPLLVLAVVIGQVGMIWSSVRCRRNRHGHFRDYLTVRFWKRNWSWWLLVLGMALLFGLGGLLGWLALAGCLALEAVCEPDDRRIRPLAWLPLLTGILVLVCLQVTVKALRREVVRQKELAQTALGNEISWQGLVAEEAEALSVDAEPLKSLIANDFVDELSVQELWLQEPSAAREKLEFSRRAHPEFFAAMSELLALPVGHLALPKIAGRAWPDELASNGREALRSVAKVLAWQLRSVGDDREAIRRCNEQFRRLREWCRNSRMASDFFWANVIERNRVMVLTWSLSQVGWSQEEFAELICVEDNMFDLGRECRRFVSNQCALREWLLDDSEKMLSQGFLRLAWPGWEVKLVQLLCRPCTDFLELFQVLDYRNCLTFGMTLSGIVSQPNLSNAERARRIEAMMAAELFCNPFQENIFSYLARTQDCYTMAWTAFEVMSRYRATGSFPANLDFLKVTPCELVSQQPFAYEAGQLHDALSDQGYTGFRLGFINGGEIRWYLSVAL